MKKENKAIKLAQIEKTNIDLFETVKSLKIDTEQQCIEALDLSNNIKARIKKVEELRLFFVEDLTKKVNEINAEFRAVRKPLKEMLSLVDKETIAWRKKELARIEEEKKKEEEKKRKAWEKEQEKLRKQREKEAEAEKKKLAKLNLSKKEEKKALKDIEEEKKSKEIEAEQDDFVFDDSDFQQSKTVHTGSGSATYKKVIDFEVVDPLKVPKKYLQVDLVAIRKAVRSGVKEISGVRIFEDTKISRKV
jgi:type I site-specific restriction-modification system R (restriction) subunit